MRNTNNKMSSVTAADITNGLLRELIGEVRKLNGLHAYTITHGLESEGLKPEEIAAVLEKAVKFGETDATAKVAPKKTTTKKAAAAEKPATADVPSPAKSTTSEGSEKTPRSTTLKMLENTYRLSFRAKYLKTFKVQLEKLTSGMDKEEKKKVEHEAMEPHFQTFWETQKTEMKPDGDKYHKDPFTLEDKRDLIDNFFTENNDDLAPARAGAGEA